MAKASSIRTNIKRGRIALAKQQEEDDATRVRYNKWAKANGKKLLKIPKRG